ncbi:MAG: TerD family protein [Alphaproteobacteria bacterium]|nr:TerD family protein [Alphaproteobacteria bacterium]
MSTIPAGQSGPLNHTKSGHERIIIGLGWDVREDKVSTVSHLVSKDSQHDLDVNCFVYDQDKNFIDFIGSEASDTIDSSGKIYHSGDNMCGTGEGDDETITVELANLPANYQTLVFLVEISSRHSFAQVEAPEVRVVDSMSNTELLHTDIVGEQAAQSNAFIFAAISRDSESATGWTLHNISDHPDISQIQDWGIHLSQYA